MDQGAWATNAVLNQYFGAMAKCIRSHGGDVSEAPSFASLPFVTFHTVLNPFSVAKCIRSHGDDGRSPSPPALPPLMCLPRAF